MSLVFGAAASDQVVGPNFGTDPTVFTTYWWHNLTALTNDRAFFTKNGSALLAIQIAAAGDASRVRFTIDYDTTDGVIVTAGGSLVLSTQQFFSLTCNATAGPPRVYMGTLTAAPTEVSYATQTTPVGTRQTDGGAFPLIGNKPSGVSPMQGSMERFCFINGTALSLAEIITHWERATQHANTKVFYELGIPDAGTQVDLSGNGNNGTVTGATVGTRFQQVATADSARRPVKPMRAAVNRAATY